MAINLDISAKQDIICRRGCYCFTDFERNLFRKCLLRIKMATKTNVYVVFENESYTIDNTVGYIPAVLLEDEGFKALFVIPKAMQFDFKAKQVEWQVEQFVWNKLTEKWIAFDSDLFIKNANGLPRLLVDGNSMVNASGQVVSENGVMSEIDFYIASLGKQAIFPALQEAIKAKI